MRTEIINGMTVHLPNKEYENTNYSADELLKGNEFDIQYYGGGRNEILRIMEVYAKQQTLAFMKFRHDYQIKEKTDIMKRQLELGGIFSWISTPDDKIYDLFIESQKTPQ